MPSDFVPHLPDYQGGSIVNLAASLTTTLGGTAPYIDPSPELLAGKEIARARNVILLVVDGLGFDTLQRLGSEGFFHHHLLGSITSVFPSTTASAIPSLLTGLAPRQHGLTGWHMHFRELGCVAAVLPFTTRHGGHSLVQKGLTPSNLLDPRPIFPRIPATSHILSPARIIDSPFNMAFTLGAQRHGYQSLDECFATLRTLIKREKGRNFYHVYWPSLDATAHQFGIGSPQVANIFQRLDAAFGKLLADIAGSDTAVIVTADHGFIDSHPERSIDLADHPELEKMLVLPLCGEQRVCYCYVHPHRCQDFEAYISDRLGNAMTAYPSRQLVEEGWFGPGHSHPRLLDRIGDYTLVMKEDWTLADYLPGEERHCMVGVHGGVSAAEMMVPLILARP